jgi:hypothetical protein
VRAAAIEKLSKRYLLPALPGFEARKKLVFKPPAKWLLRGFAYETSGSTGRDFYVWVFVQPLYVPVDHLVLSFGKRLGGTSRFWSLDEASEEDLMTDVAAAARREGLPFLEQVKEPAQLAELAMDRLHPADPNRDEVVAYSRILDGDAEKARPVVAGLVDRARPDEPDWVGEVRARARKMQELLDRGGNAPMEQLRAWRDQTATALGLD